MAQLLKNVSLKRNGSNDSVNVAKELESKVVAIYFSAHWCPPCRAFTPVLKEFYDKLKSSGEFEIVFVSFDRSDKDLQSYLKEAHGDWLYITYNDPNIQSLANQFDVDGIPSLIVVKPDGTLISKEARGDVEMKSPSEALAEWKSKL